MIDRLNEPSGVDGPQPVRYSSLATLHRSGMIHDAQADSIAKAVTVPTFWLPEFLDHSAWVEHAPFAFWLVDALRPRAFVELGTHRGYSYFAICQAVRQLKLATRCYAIDTWQGDEHAGFYDESVFARVRDYHDRRYADFSQLVRATFDDALQYIPDGSVDLLHIDGRHFYDDVKHDFEAWQEKLSDRSVVILHDTNVRERDFGVFKLWGELQARYPNFEFLHGHGLGVIAYGPLVPEPVSRFLEQQSTESIAAIRQIYGRLGGSLATLLELRAQNATVTELRAGIGRNEERLAAQASRHDLLISDHARRMEKAEHERKKTEEQRRYAEEQHRETLRSLVESRQKQEAQADQIADLLVQRSYLEGRLHEKHEQWRALRRSWPWKATALLRELDGGLNKLRRRRRSQRTKLQGRNARRGFFSRLGRSIGKRYRRLRLLPSNPVAQPRPASSGNGFGWYGADALSSGQLFDRSLVTSRDLYEEQTATIVRRYALIEARPAPLPLHMRLGSGEAVRRLLQTATVPTAVTPTETPTRYSIVTAYYQHVDFFRRCAESVAALADAMDPSTNTRRVEWIVLNDDPAMEETSLRQLIPPSLLDSTRIVSDGANRGIVHRSNQGVEAAQFPWILFLDCDDEIEPGALPILDHYIAKMPRCRYICSSMLDIDEHGNVLRHRRHEYPTTELFERGMVAGHLKAIRRDLIDELGGFTPRFSGVQDYDFALRAAAREPLLQIPEPLYRYRWHGQSQSVSSQSRQARLARLVRAHFLRTHLAAPASAPICTDELRQEPQGLCIIRTQGSRLELLATAVRSVLEQKPRITPCVVVHGNEVVFSDLRDWLAEIDTKVLVLHASATDRRRGHPCNVALDFLKANPQAYDFLCFLDDDDHLLPGFSERLTEAARLSRADVVFGMTNAVSEGGVVKAMHPLLPVAALFIDNFIPINAYIVRTHAVLACAARFDETINYLEDWDFLLQLLGAGARFVPLFETVSEFRLIGDGNIAVKKDPMHFEECAVRIRTRTRAVLDTLSPGIFWRDVVDFPEDETVFFETRQLRQLEASRTLFKA